MSDPIEVDVEIPERIEITLSSMPPMIGEATLLVGLEGQDGKTFRAYLGHRSRGVYLEIPIEDLDPWQRAWNTGGHIWVWPVPPADLLHRESVVP